MKTFIETHFGLMLIGAAILGFLIPGAANLPASLITLMLAFVIFLSCVRIQPADFKQLDWPGIGLFWIGRYVALPLAMYGGARLVLPDYASGVLLLALLPAGVSSAAFTGLFGGNVPSALFLTILSSLASVILIPLLFGTIDHRNVNSPPMPLLLTLTECILVPALLAYPLRRVEVLTAFSFKWGKLITVLLIALMVTIIIAGQRDAILNHPLDVLVPLPIALVSFGIFIAVGMVGFRRSPENRIAMLTCSAYNNQALGMTLALLHFPPHAVMTIVMGEIAWTLLPLATRRLTRTMQVQITV